MRTKDIIVTFGCQESVFVYKPKCGVLPRSPYRSHESVEAAENHLKLKGIVNPKIITEWPLEQ
jgi:hypothetical protein